MNSQTPNEMIVRVQNLRKEYSAPIGVCKTNKDFVAVEKLSFGLEIGECFALLGVNGAGKTTTFKSLMNEIDLTSGQVTIGNYDVKTDFVQVRKMIGYCP